MVHVLRQHDGARLDVAQVGSDLISQHLAQPESKQMGSITAVGSGHDIATYTSGSTGTSMAQSAAIGQAGAKREVRVDVADAITGIGPLSLGTIKFALEELAPAPNGPEGIVANDAYGGSRCVNVAASSADLIDQRLVNAGLKIVRRLGIVDHLCIRRQRRQPRDYNVGHVIERSLSPHGVITPSSGHAC